MGSVDNLYTLIGIFAFVIIMLVAAVLWSNLAGIDDLWSQTDYGSTIKDNTQSFVDKYDFFFVCFYIGIHLAVIALAFLLRTHPVGYVLAIAFTVLLVLIAAPLSNSWEEEIITDAAFSTVISDFSMTDHIMKQLPVYEFIWAVLTIIALFSMARYEEIL